MISSCPQLVAVVDVDSTMKSMNYSGSMGDGPILANLIGSPAPWNRTTIAALLTLVALWAFKVHSTWAAWGDLTVDSGHEMYVPALLAEGKVLYRDTWFMYGPASPYMNSYLFRLFGVHLNVLYWAGSLSALGSAIFLYLAGMRLSSWLVGWTAAAALLIEAFQPSLFCFPLPYSFGAVYGCLMACLFIWLILNSAISKEWGWMFALGTTSALALLIKPEFGTAAYLTVGIWIALRVCEERSWAGFLRDILAILPGLVVSALIIRWMIHIAGVEFITQENIMSWPTSYFMKTYGKVWLGVTGFSLAAPDLYNAAIRTLPLIVAGFVADWTLSPKRSERTPLALKVILCLLFVASVVGPDFRNFVKSPWFVLEVSLGRIFFPQDMVLYVGLAACASWWYFWRKRSTGIGAGIPLLLTFTAVLAFRILMGMRAGGYAIYYNGPVVLCFLLLARLVVPRVGRTQRFIFIGEALICVMSLTVVTLTARRIERIAKNYVPLSTQRGTVRVSKQMAIEYAEAIKFMKEKAALSESVLSIPEDTSLYFLSATYCPTRAYNFTPGAIVPGRMTAETIQQIEQKPVRYLVWSNRVFPEYGAPVFGTDFDQSLGDYLKAHYRAVRPLITSTDSTLHWTAYIWIRSPETELIQSNQH